ncbi:MAG: ArgP/LysG family DNA-binding transcriptional regulator [Alphaproteobacteria bacterium HGW-Alphaproteobacteria-6]|nr:MAG: ArgP/LysG family DNA-binding transcriptional regulator [Alphaproteobacteria bacterium HGW-Alphaproteobacteria-6]
MFDHAQIRALAAVLRSGSFEAAAAELHLTPSAISQRIRALEERLGTVLVIRGQPARPTDAGARLARHAEEIGLLEHLLAADLGLAGIDRPGAAITLRIAVNADSLATWLLPALAAAGALGADLLFDLAIDDQDHSEDWLRRGAVSAAITARPGPVQGCDSHPLGLLRYRATASPAYMARWFADGVTAASLARAPAITYDTKDRLQERWLRAVTGRRPGYRSHMIPSARGFVDAARLGLGWGMIPEALVRADLDAGRLVELVADRPLDLALHWQVSRMTGAALAPLTRAILATARQSLIAP